jgi:hypothetical protein
MSHLLVAIHTTGFLSLSLSQTPFWDPLLQAISASSRQGCGLWMESMDPMGMSQSSRQVRRDAGFPNGRCAWKPVKP